jgi:serine/threonine protein kinase
VVFLGTYCGRRCALKEMVFPSTTATTANHQEAARREATLLTRLRHPHLVYYWGHCFHEDYMYLVMEYCERSLEAVLHAYGAKRERLPAAAFVKVQYEVF